MSLRQDFTGFEDKTKDIDELAGILGLLRAEGKTVVHCHGAFDLLHIGHIRHFKQARRLGDVLVVTLTPDRFVNKGPHRPAFEEQLRAEAIAALEYVDFVAINKWPTAVEAIKLLRPDLYVKGSDYKVAEEDHTGGIILEEESVKSVGGRLVFTDDIVFSSSSLINRNLPVFSKEATEFLELFARQFSAEEIIQYLENAGKLKVLVVGETIIDEYQYCEQIGKTAKDPVLAVKYISTEKFAGGVLAIANHVANFCDQVAVLTFLGKDASQEEFIKESMNEAIEQIYLCRDDSPTIVKRRFVENYLFQKLFEVYDMNGENLNEAQNQEFCDKLTEILPQFDVVIVADYGHGMLTPEAIEILCSKSKFLAVNTQANAGNRGLSTVSKYPRADFVSLAGHEIALEERNFRGELKDMIRNVSHKLSCPKVLVTCGKDGNLGYDAKEGLFQVPAFAGKVVDRMGAGDAVLSLTAPCVAQQAPMAVITFIANVAGAEAIAMLGHQKSIEPASLFKHIVSLLK